MLRFSDLMESEDQQSRQRFYKILSGLTASEQERLWYSWAFWARENQIPPFGDWTHWLVLAGRGFGKTRTGAEWVRSMVEQGKATRIALVAPTSADVREVMIEGESGLLSIAPPDFRPRFEPSKRRLTWPNGAIATAFSADEPERLRGPQHDLAWCDELCAWRQSQEAFDMLMFGLRLGERPRTCITTTPKPTAHLKSLIQNRQTVVTRGTTFDNLANLAPTFKSEILDRYEGTRIGRQELNAEILEDVAGALWNRKQLDNYRVEAAPELDRIIVAIDPPATATGDECGLIAVGRAQDRYFVLADMTASGLSPRQWATRAVSLYHRLKADRIVAEVNQGGDMIEALLRAEDSSIPYEPLRATRGKVTRAEPVAALYEQGRVCHVGAFPDLEDQMVSFTAGFDRAQMGYSPDRVDALVWAITALTSARSVSRVREV